jgi:hypothetical protein
VKGLYLVLSGSLNRLPPVISQNLNPYVSMMQSTRNWYRCDGTELLPWPKIG